MGLSISPFLEQRWLVCVANVIGEVLFEGPPHLPPSLPPARV